LRIRWSFQIGDYVTGPKVNFEPFIDVKNGSQTSF
jgi:hypothetical protein